MNQILSRAEVFDLSQLGAWGGYALNSIQRKSLNLIEKLPVSWLGRRLALILRKSVKNSHQVYFDRRVWGLRMRLCAKGNLSEQRWLTMAKFHDAVEREALLRTFKPGAVFVDLGANAGFYTFWALANATEGMRIVSVEPSDAMLQTIRFNLALNDATDQVELVQCALTAEPCEVFLNEDSVNLGESSVSTEAASAGSKSVPGRPLYDVLNTAGVSEVSALKIDIEGHEEVVLGAFFETAPKSLWPKMILGEIVGEGSESFTQLLADRGYRLTEQTKMNGVFELT